MRIVTPKQFFSNPGDWNELARLYDASPHDKLNLITFDFVWKIGYVTYLDCAAEGLCTYEGEYMGEGFNDFIKEETHYHLVRLGLLEKCDEELYQKARRGVLNGLVKKAINFLAKREKGILKENEKLKSSLEDWIELPKEELSTAA